MACTEVRMGDIGTVIEITVIDCGSVVNLSTATTKELIFKNPDGIIKTTTAGFVTDGTDGKIAYTTVADFLDVEGTWKVQANIIMPSWTGRSSVSTFTVKSNL